MNLFDPATQDSLLFAQKLDQDVINLVANTLGDHSFFVADEPLPIVLLERSDREDWAVDWAITTLELLKQLSLTHLLTDPYLSGRAWGFESEYQADLPEALEIGQFPDEVKLKVPKGETVTVSFFERAYDVTSAPFCSAVANKISPWMLRFASYTAPGGEDLEVILPYGGEILFNSLFIAGDGELVEGEELLLYENLQATLQKIFNQLRLTECRVLSQFEVIQPFSVKIEKQTPENWNEFTASRGYPTPAEFHPPDLRIPDGGLRFANPVYKKIPEWYHFAHLQIAGEEDFQGVPLVWRQNGGIFEAELGYVGDLAGGNAQATIKYQQVAGWIGSNFDKYSGMFVGLDALPRTVNLTAATDGVRRVIRSENFSGDISFFGEYWYRLFGDWFTYSIHGFFPPGLTKSTTNWFCANVTKCSKRPTFAGWFQTRIKGTFHNQIKGNGKVSFFSTFEQEEKGGLTWGDVPGIFTQEFGFVMKIEFWDTAPNYLPQFKQPSQQSASTFPQFTQAEFEERFNPAPT